MKCPEVHDLLPELERGELTLQRRREVEAHLAACGECPECAEAREIVRALIVSRPAVPVGLEARIQAAVRREMAADDESGDLLRLEPRRRRSVPSWALGAAALLMLAVGTPVLMNRMAEVPTEYDDATIALAEETYAPSVWASDDGLIAGALALDDLSDEALLALLEELEAGA